MGPTRVTSVQIRRLSLEAEVDPKTIRRLLDGLPVRDGSRERIHAAAKRLKIKLERNGK